MSISKIIGREGRIVWDNFPVSLKYWMIEWDKPDGGKESWHGKAIISQIRPSCHDGRACKNHSHPINEPIFVELNKGKKVYRGMFLISAFPDPIDSNPVIDFIGTGELREH